MTGDEATKRIANIEHIKQRAAVNQRRTGHHRIDYSDPLNAS